jgi:methylisocitrate lyase
MALTRDEFHFRLKQGKTIWAACCYDALTAKIIEHVGFDATFTSGYGIAASFLGAPDLELYTMTENLTIVRNIVNAVSFPVIADTDTGYGNVVNVTRTVREFEAAGVIAMTLEDQESPKKCPMYGSSIPIVPVEDQVAKIRAAVAARRDPGFLIVARTDATDPEESCARAKAYANAGADILMPINRTFKNFDGARAFRAAAGKPILLPVNAGGPYDVDKAQMESVAGIVIYPMDPLMTVAQAFMDNMKALCDTRSLKNLPHPLMPYNEFRSFIGFADVEALHEKFKPAPVSKVAGG